MTVMILLAGLAIASVVGTVLATVRDGYGARPVLRPMREYQRDEHYRA